MGLWEYFSWSQPGVGAGQQHPLPGMKSLYAALPLRVITHNIRYATTSPFEGEEPWSARAPGLLNELRFHTIYNQEVFIGLQEVLNSQLTDIMTGLNSESSPAAGSYIRVEPSPRPDAAQWAYLGVGRDDGKEAGEYSPILYRPAVWDVEDYQYFWLSETPHVPSRGWDASSIRIVTVGRFRHRDSSKRVLMLNTHLDDAGSVSRQKSAELITSYINDYLNKHANGTALPVILTGDFNSEPTDEAYRYLSNPPSVVRDIRDSVPEALQYGNTLTFTGFSSADGSPKRIDFIFAGPWENSTSAIAAYKTYAVLANKFDDGVYISDHRAVVGDLEL